MASTSTDRVVLKLSCNSSSLWLRFREAAERDRCLCATAMLVDTSLVIAPGESSGHGHGHDRALKYPDDHLWPYLVTVATVERFHRRYSERFSRPHLRTALSAPRFAPIETEGVWEDGLLCIDLPLLTELPWPQTYGACADEENQRAARERISWGVATGLIATKRQAAEYLRTHAPQRAKDAVRRIWGDLVSALDLPD